MAHPRSTLHTPSRLSAMAVLLVTIGACPGGGRRPFEATTDLGASGDLATYDGPEVASMIIHGCTEDAYEDMSAQSADRTVYFGTTGGFTFSPPCTRIAVGQSVTFRGPFGSHALSPGVAPSRVSDGQGSPANPIEQVTTGTQATFTFGTPGYFPFYCRQHWDSSMYGVILVR